MCHDVWYNENTRQLCMKCTSTAGFTNRDKMVKMDAMRVFSIIWESEIIQDIWTTSHNFPQFSQIFLGKDLWFLPWNVYNSHFLRIFVTVWARHNDVEMQQRSKKSSLCLRHRLVHSMVSMWLGTWKERKMHYIFSRTPVWKIDGYFAVLLGCFRFWKVGRYVLPLKHIDQWKLPF